MDKLLERRVEEGSLKLLIFNMMFDTLFDVPCLDTACSSRYKGTWPLKRKAVKLLQQSGGRCVSENTA